MTLSVSEQRGAPADLLALRQLIAQQAQLCDLELSDRRAVRALLDADPLACSTSSRELRLMLILLFRLEASSSEDIGIEGLRRLWHQHNEILVKFSASENRAFSRTNSGMAGA
jgi:hypothetical protein